MEERKKTAERTLLLLCLMGLFCAAACARRSGSVLPLGQETTEKPSVTSSVSSAPSQISSTKVPVPSVTEPLTTPGVTLLPSPSSAVSATPTAELRAATPYPAPHGTIVTYGVHELKLYTADSAPVSSKTEYVAARMLADGAESETSIRGRGNSSWHQFPKKAYRLKLGEKTGLFGMPADKDWVLVPNYVDPSLIRNAVTYDMAKVLSNLTWTPAFRFTDLYMNDEYLGLYMICEKIEEAEHKLPLGTPVLDEKGSVSDMGFILEWGWDYDCENIFGLDYFMTNSGDSLYIKDPKVKYQYDDVMTYTRRYIKALENAAESYGDYEKYIDVDNWVDWFIINELTNNTECSFYRSLYMYKPAGGKLCLGPLWDYDTAFGNFSGDISDYNGWVAVDSTYVYFEKKDIIAFILEDAAFQEKVRKRWAEVKEDLLSTALLSIDLRCEEIEESRIRDEERWPKVLSGGRIGMARSTTYGFTDYESHIG
ncbi:MAG: CotH kinase family protein, partial [Lachnospiraceae bacterium]|nr:CotH kinase family protein [Lachnospiraceae bacterium]